MNKIYRVIWNCTLGLWVVTSELGRGRIKRATNRALAGLTLAVLSPVSLATDCDNVALECQLDSVWSTSTNNNRAGTAVISDGQAYRIDMLSSITAAKGTSTSYGSINALINAGYATGPLVPDTDSYLQLSAKNKNITVFDPITNSNLVVTVYDENNFREYKSTANPGGSFRVFPSGPVDVYYNTRFVAVTNGQADVYNNNNTISASFRDSQLFYADGSSSTATINWHGTSSIGFGWETSSTSSTTYTAQKTTYVGEFSGFDGSTQNVTNLSELKAYNAWLVSQVQAGNLSTGAYASELTKAYQNTGTTYVINPLPADADPILLSPPGTVVLLHGTGSGANINLASDSHLTSSSLRGLDSGATTTSLIRLTSGANAVNDGYISTGFRIGVLYSGSRLTNNGTMITGTSGGIEGYGINVYDAGTEFINNGTFNVIPRFWSGLASQNQANNLMVTISNGAKAVNNGVVNLGITEGTRTTEYLGQVVGAMLSATAGSFINGVDGEMYVGRSQDGKDMFAAAGSAAIKVNTLSSGTVDNQGLIALSTRSSGAYGITASWTKAPAQVINSGTITLKGDGGGGAFLPGQNIGIYAYNSARGVSNTGTVNVGGVNNVGVKTLSGGQIGSSGQINVTGSADPSTDLRNYGAWAEGANSLVDISGTVNLEGDGAIGLHARDKGTISLSGNGQVTFADGENQIGYYVYGAGSKITNTSTGSQDVTTNNSTLMRLDGGA
ncbi:ESPR domain-containing protein, partial [Leminorella grimontii]